jgi:UDP-N-acetylglucosamine--N-acetylmuramyl-(pentapeptide) pyrophosphoryl-undecaprenol N-acetylglucosamine transferase
LIEQASGPRRIAVAGGGTAGHILPALELLRAYRREVPGTIGYFIGCGAPDGLEARLAPAHGERLEIVPGGPWARQGFAGKAGAVTSLLSGVAAARRLLLRERTQLLIAVGGYAGFGACVAARMLGIPVVLHEANAEEGLANRFAARLVTVVCTGFPEAASRFAGAVYTGTPCRTVPAAGVSGTSGPLRLLVLGGSQGSPFLNREAPAFAAALGIPVVVRHFAGLEDPAPVESAYRNLGIPAVVEPFREVFPVEAYAEADFALSCAGGITLAELSAAGIPSLLVPLGYVSGNHQAPNARAYCARTGCPWVSEPEWDADVQAALVRDLLRDSTAMPEVRRRVREWNPPDPAAAIVRVCEELLSSRTS